MVTNSKLYEMDKEQRLEKIQKPCQLVEVPQFLSSKAPRMRWRNFDRFGR